MNDLLNRMLHNDWDSPAEFDLAGMAARLWTGFKRDPYAANASSRVVPKPHQIYVANKAVRGSLYPRMLLADDVGLGKTIEAGLILKGLKTLGLVKRTLIVAPASLVTQWESELRRKFNETFRIFNAALESEEQRGNADRNIWREQHQVICTLDFAAYNERRSEQLADAGWDLVIFDEAHHIRRTKSSGGRADANRAYEFAQAIRSQTKGLLFLTATPMQLHPYEFYSLLELLDPGLFADEQEFNRKVEARRRINELLGRVERFDQLGPEERRETATGLAAAVGSSDGRFAPAMLTTTLLEPPTRQALMDQLVALDPLASVMVRNRKVRLGTVVKRVPRVIPVRMSAEEQAVYTQMKEYIQRGFARSEAERNYAVQLVMVSFQRLLTSSPFALANALSNRIETLERKEAALPGAADTPPLSADDDPDDLFTVVSSTSYRVMGDEVKALRELQGKVNGLRVDSKLEALLVTLKPLLADPKQKVLIFTQFKKTLEYLQKALQTRYRLVATFHGGMNVRDKDREVEIFRTRAQIMIATEAGGEGRNFQFCNVVINYDLPWNPMKIEQRIGRVDRIGQERQVEIYNFSILDTIESRVLEVLQNRIRIFEQTVGGLDPILGDVEDDLNRLALTPGTSSESQVVEFGRVLEERVAQARAVEERQADRMMDWASFQKSAFAEFMSRRPGFTARDVEAFLERYFTLWGRASRTEDGALGLEPPGIWRERYPRLYDYVQHVGACDLELAQEREDLQFFAVGHPLVTAALESCLGPKAPGRVTSRCCRVEGAHNRYLLQCNLLITYTGVREQVRFESVCVNLDEDEWDQDLFDRVPLTLSEPGEGLKLSQDMAAKVKEYWHMIEATARDEANDGLAAFNQENKRLWEQERARLERHYRFLIRSVQKDLVRFKEQRAHIDLFGTGTQRQILHVYDSRILKLGKQLKALERDQEASLKALEKRSAVSVHVSVHSAAFVWLQ